MQSVQRCLDVLEAVAAAARPIGVSELARRVNLSKATVHRLCQTLVDRHFLQQEPRSAHYSPGWRLLEVTCRLAGQFNLSRVSRPILEHMAADGRQNAFAGTIVDHWQMLIYDEVRVDNPIQPRSLLGLRLPLLEAPGGLLCLAHLPPERTRSVVEEILAKFAQDAAGPVEHLVEQIQSLRGRPYAVQTDLPYPNVTVVCCPVTGKDGRIAGVLGYCHPTLQHSPVDHDHLGHGCSQAARNLSTILGSLSCSGCPGETG